MLAGPPRDVPTLPTLAEIVVAASRREQSEIRAALRTVVASLCEGEHPSLGRGDSSQDAKERVGLLNNAEELLYRADELYQAGVGALSGVARLSAAQTRELFSVFRQVREAFWQELHSVPFVARQRAAELGEMVRGGNQRKLLYQARSDTRTASERKAEAERCLAAYSKLGAKRSSNPRQLKESGVSCMLAALPAKPERLLERGSEVRKKTGRLLELEAALLCQHHSLDSEGARNDARHAEHQELCADLGGGAFEARRRLASLDASVRPYLALKNYLYLANVGLSRAAKRHSEQEYHCRQDLYQGASLGLLEAIERYEPEAGALATCADSWVKRGRAEAERLAGRVVSIPGSIEPAYRALCRLANGRSDEQAEQAVASQYRLDLKTVKALGRLSQGILSVENSQRDTDVESSLAKVLMAKAADSGLSSLFEAEQKEKLTAALALLPLRHRQVVEAYVGLGSNREASFSEIAANIGVTKERVRQIYLRALTKMRDALSSDETQP